MLTDLPPSTRRRARRRLADVASACVAREKHGGYAARADDGTAGSGPDAAPAPFDLPVLAEVPELAELLTWLADADRLAVRAAVRFAELADAGRAEETTGAGLDHWVAAIARTTQLERSTLRRVARLLTRLPSLRAAADDGSLSFAQLRSLALRLRTIPDQVCEQLDEWVGSAIAELPDSADPDAIVTLAARAADELAPEVLDAEAEEVASHRFLHIQPNLTGTGGRFYGEEDALGLAILDAATAPTIDQLDDVGRGRADNLRDRLQASHCHGHPVDHDADRQVGHDGCDAVDDVADRQVEPADGCTLDGETCVGPASGMAPPKLLLRWELDSLLDRSASPAELIVRLSGGRLRLQSDAARRLIDERGAELRTVIVDQGRVVGVGGTARFARGWLRDGVFAVHDVCTEPLCTRPALGAHIDHATPFVPEEPGQPFGRTDLDELGPLCATTNVDRRASGWRPRQHDTTGLRTWTHTRTGIVITSVPGTWRPTAYRPSPRELKRPPPDPDDPIPF